MRYVDLTNPDALRNAGMEAFARHAGIAAAVEDFDTARSLIGKIKNVFRDLMRKPVSAEWESLPRPSKLLSEAATAFSQARLPGSMNVGDFTTAVDQWFRSGIAENCPVVGKLAVDARIQSDTLRRIVTNLMLERDHSADTIRAGARKIFGPIGRRIAGTKALQLEADFLNQPPRGAIINSIAHTCRTLIRELHHGASTSTHPTDEIKALVQAIEQVCPADHPVVAELTQSLHISRENGGLKAA